MTYRGLKGVLIDVIEAILSIFAVHNGPVGSSQHLIAENVAHHFRAAQKTRTRGPEAVQRPAGGKNQENKINLWDSVALCTFPFSLVLGFGVV